MNGRFRIPFIGRLLAEPTVVPAFALVAGIAIGNLHPAAIFWLALAGAGLVLMAVQNRSHTLLLFIFAAGAAHVSTRRQHAAAIPFLAEIELGDGQFITATGTVVSPPAIDFQTGRSRCFLRLKSIANDESCFASSQTVQFTYPPGAEPLLYGDSLAVHGLLRHPRRARNPGAFDESGYLQQRGIAAEIVSTWPGDLSLTGRNGGNPLIAASLHAREWISDALMRDLDDEPRARILQAVVLGERRGVPWQIGENFRLSGTMHVFAVSGLHVGLLGLLVFELLKAVGIPRRGAILGVIITVILYAFVTGLRPSAVRAAVMMTVLLGGILAHRPARILNSLGTAALIILLFDPLQLFRPGFQLSFLVLLSIALLAPVLRTLFSSWIKPDPFLPLSLLSPRQRFMGNVGGGFADYLSITSSAWLGSLPLILAYFHLVSPIALLANFFVVPVAFAILFAALGCLILTAAQLTGLAIIVNNASFAIASLMALLVAFFASIPGGHYFVPWERFLDRHSATIEVLDIDSGSTPAIAHLGGNTSLLGSAPSRFDRRATRDYQRGYGFPRLVAFDPASSNSWTPLLDSNPHAGVLEVDCWRILFLDGLSFDGEKQILDTNPAALACDVLIKGIAPRDLSGLPGTIAAANPKVVILGQSHSGGGDQTQRELRDRLLENGHIVLYQPDTGAVTIGVKGDQLQIRTMLTSASYTLTRNPRQTVPAE